MTTTTPLPDRIVLGVAGVVILTIGALTTFAPDALLGSYEVTLPGDAGLRSELRAAGALLLTLGALVLAGAARSALSRTAALVSALAYTAYVLGRGVSWIVDGTPPSGLIAALVIEAVLAVASALVWFRLRARARTA